jgi:hypothetical protein
VYFWKEYLMTQLLRISAYMVFFWFGLMPAFAQTVPAKPRSPGEIAAADRLAMAERASCQQEARAQRLSYFKRRSYVKECVKR